MSGWGRTNREGVAAAARDSRATHLVVWDIRGKWKLLRLDKHD
jgi:hypothetical protein